MEPAETGLGPSAAHPCGPTDRCGGTQLGSAQDPCNPSAWHGSWKGWILSSPSSPSCLKWLGTVCHCPLQPTAPSHLPGPPRWAPLPCTPTPATLPAVLKAGPLPSLAPTSFSGLQGGQQAAFTCGSQSKAHLAGAGTSASHVCGGHNLGKAETFDLWPCLLS